MGVLFSPHFGGFGDRLGLQEMGAGTHFLRCPIWLVVTHWPPVRQVCDFRYSIVKVLRVGFVCVFLLVPVRPPPHFRGIGDQ